MLYIFYFLQDHNTITLEACSRGMMTQMWCTTIGNLTNRAGEWIALSCSTTSTGAQTAVTHSEATFARKVNCIQQ